MAGKDNWRGFLDAIYSKWRLFLPILSPLLRSPTASPAAPSSPTPHLLASSHLSSPCFLPFFFSSSSASILYSDVKYGLTFPAWLRGRLSVNCKFWPTLQFIWNGKSGEAICRNRGGSLNFPPLSEFVCVPAAAENLKGSIDSGISMLSTIPRNGTGCDWNLHFV